MRLLISLLAACGLCAATAARAQDRTIPESASPWTFYARLGGVTEGPQHTFERGVEFGAGLDAHPWTSGAIGLGFGVVHEDRAGLSINSYSLEGHGRAYLTRTRIRPLVEAGLGWYRLSASAFTSRDCPGAWLGIGAEGRVTELVALRLGVAYHFLAESIELDGGNAEDYFATGLTLEFGLPHTR